jgi:hypothetical protein
MDNSVCEEILENIKTSLLHCKNNRTTHTMEKAFNIKSCENINKYKTSLYATKTKIILNVPDYTSSYSINYKVNERIIEVE